MLNFSVLILRCVFETVSFYKKKLLKNDWNPRKWNPLARFTGGFYIFIENLTTWRMSTCQQNYYQMNTTVTFLDFETKQNYLRLQNRFATQDVRNPPGENTYENPVKDFNIIVKTVNEVTLEEEYIELFFLKDFLYPKIDTMAKRFIHFFKKELDAKLILDPKKIELFAKKYYEKITIVNEKVLNSGYLNVLIQKKLIVQLDVIMEYLTQVHINPNYSFAEKMEFKLNKTDLLNLFILLREHDYIGHKYDRDLGRLIDNFFVYYDDNLKDYKNISNSKRVLNDLNNGNRGNNKSYQRMQNMFTKLLASVSDN